MLTYKFYLKYFHKRFNLDCKFIVTIMSLDIMLSTNISGSFQELLFNSLPHILKRLSSS